LVVDGDVEIGGSEIVGVDVMLPVLVVVVGTGCVVVDIDGTEITGTAVVEVGVVAAGAGAAYVVVIVVGSPYPSSWLVVLTLPAVIPVLVSYI